MLDNLKKSQMRITQYQHVDGTFEIFFGGICLLWGIFFLLQSKLIMPEGFIKLVVEMASFLVLSGSGAFLLDRLMKAIRERLTYSRTGFVANRKLQKGKLIGRLLVMAGIAAAIGALFTAFFASNPVNVDWMPLGSGALFAIAMSIVAWRTQLPRYYLFAVISALVGLGDSNLGLAELPGLAVFYSSIGFLLLIMGGIVLWRYLRQNPLPSKGTSDEL